jgi:hypothetical protein
LIQEKELGATRELADVVKVGIHSSAGIPVVRVQGPRSLLYTNLTDLRNSMRVRLVNTMLLSSQSNIPASIESMVSACGENDRIDCGPSAAGQSRSLDRSIALDGVNLEKFKLTKMKRSIKEQTWKTFQVFNSDGC